MYKCKVLSSIPMYQVNRVVCVNSPLQFVPRPGTHNAATVAATDVASELTQAKWVNPGTAISVQIKMGCINLPLTVAVDIS